MKPFFTASDIETKRARSEGELDGLSTELIPLLLTRFRDKSQSRECPQCKKANQNNRIYCYQCLVPLQSPCEYLPPKVILPLKLDIVRHPKELKTKSTALHAQVLCGSDQVRTEELPQSMSKLNDGSIDPTRTLLLFPTADSKELTEMENLSHYNRIVVIDCTWQQANSMLRSEFCSQVLKDCPRVRLGKTHETSFWRHQQKGTDHLATIEAIYYFYREYIEAVEKKAYDGRVDNLLFLFVGMLRLIESSKAQVSE